MCGMCGVLSPELTWEQMEIFQGLMVVSALRGPYGAGFAAVPKGNQPIEIRRNPELTAAELVHGSSFYSILHDPKRPKKNREYSCLMGHARYPTSGSYGTDAIHPHHYGDILGMHNGTFKNVNGKTIGDKDNDSALFFEAAEKQGVVQTALNSNGSYSLVWINRSSDTISFLRNVERPMHFARVEGEDALFWASEQGMLQLILRRKVGNKKITYLNLNPGVVMSFRLHNQGRVELFSHRNINTPGTVITPAGPTGPHLPLGRPTEHDVAKLVAYSFPADGRYGTWQHTYFDRADLDTILRRGCINCREEKNFADYDKQTIYFCDPKEFICHTCLDYDQTAQEYFTSHGLPLPLGIKPISQSRH